MRRRRLGTALAVLAIAVAGAFVAQVAFDRLVYEPEPPARRGVADAPVATAVQVLSVRGAVERASRLGAWSPVASGDQLAAEDSIRTGAASTVELGVGERSRMTVADGSLITVREVTSAVHRFNLARGRIAVDYGQDRERRLRVEDESGRAVEAKEARFGVLATGAMLAVATEAGSVTLRAGGGSVDVHAGEQSAARGDDPPSRAEPIPTAVLLMVASAAAHLERGGCAALVGAASPASLVQVDGEPVPLDDGGHFDVRVRRRRGRAAVLVTVADALGRTTRRMVPCREVEPDVKDLRVRWKR